MLSPAGVVNDLIYKGSIHNPFPCHVLVHIINIKPSSTPQSLISPGLYTHAVSPASCPPSSPPPPPFPSLARRYLDLPLPPIQLHCTCHSLSHRPRLTCKVFLSHVAVMKRASHVEKGRKKTTPHVKLWNFPYLLFSCEISESSVDICLFVLFVSPLFCPQGYLPFFFFFLKNFRSATDFSFEISLIHFNSCLQQKCILSVKPFSPSSVSTVRCLFWCSELFCVFVSQLMFSFV